MSLLKPVKVVIIGRGLAGLVVECLGRERGTVAIVSDQTSATLLNTYCETREQGKASR